MNLGNLGSDNEPRDFEELVWCYISIAYDLLRLRRITEAAICIGSLRSNSAELGHKRVMFARKKVMQKT